MISETGCAAYGVGIWKFDYCHFFCDIAPMVFFLVSNCTHVQQDFYSA